MITKKIIFTGLIVLAVLIGVYLYSHQLASILPDDANIKIKIGDLSSTVILNGEDITASLQANHPVLSILLTPVTILVSGIVTLAGMLVALAGMLISVFVMVIGIIIPVAVIIAIIFVIVTLAEGLFL